MEAYMQGHVRLCKLFNDSLLIMNTERPFNMCLQSQSTLYSLRSWLKKNSAAPRFLNPLLSVWISDLTLFFSCLVVLRLNDIFPGLQLILCMHISKEALQSVP